MPSRGWRRSRLEGLPRHQRSYTTTRDVTRQATYDRIGVAWIDRERDSVYVRLHGTQIVSGGFSLYPMNREDDATDTAPENDAA